MVKENVIYKIIIDILNHHYQASENTDYKVSLFI